jgi:hypothetical protein
VEPINPYQSPEIPAEEAAATPLQRPARLENRFVDAFVVGTWLFRRNWLRVAVIVVIVWLPIELYMSYQELFVLDPNDFARYFRLQWTMEGLFGVIGIGAIVAVGSAYWQAGRPSSLGEAFSASLSQWGRFFLGGILGSVLMLVGLLLLILPGLFIAVCLGYLFPLYIVEQPGIVNGLKRSVDLGRRHFWFSLALMVATTTIEFVAGVIMGIAMIGIELIEPPDTVLWIANALASLPLALIAAWMWLVITAALLRMLEEEKEEAQTAPAMP